MPLIEELPVTAGANTRSHGWAYVPDTTYDPSQALGASASRKKRLARDATNRRPGAGSDTTAKQAKAIAARLADLDKENWKDAAAIPVPTVSVTKTKGKATANVRRILTSGRNFNHWLAAEEAELAQNPSTSNQSSLAATVQRANASRATPSKTVLNQQGNSIHSTPAPTTPAPETSRPSSTPAVDPLLVSHIPKPPSKRVINILLSEPPLSYNAARGGPSKQGKPNRHFCAVCGYWGKVKCLKCGDRTCGMMDCWRSHEETCVAGYL